MVTSLQLNPEFLRAQGSSKTAAVTSRMPQTAAAFSSGKGEFLPNTPFPQVRKVAHMATQFCGRPRAGAELENTELGC